MTMSLQSATVIASQGEILMPLITESKRETLKIRIKPEVRDLIDHAAKSREKNRTDFILESARIAAEDTLLDHRLSVDQKLHGQGFTQLAG